jgi:hypothetical protein
LGLEAYAAYCVWLAVDKGRVAYVDELKSKTSIGLALPFLSTLMLAGDDISVQLYCDAGSISLPLALTDVQAKAQKEAEEQRQRAVAEREKARAQRQKSGAGPPKSR